MKALGWSVAVVVVASAAAAAVQTSGGRVRVHEVTFPTQNGQWLVADVFRPASATEASPAPLVVVVPGFQRSKEALSNIAIELSRRGIVAISIDPYAQGSSSSSATTQSATTEGYGAFAVIDYVARTPNLNYVDKARLGITGHSAGGNAAIRGASYFGRQAARSGKPSPLHAVFVSGYVLTLTTDVLKHVRSNLGMSYALYDEGAYRNELGHGDMRTAPEALRFVNSGLADGETPVAEVEPGRYYGDAAARTLRVVHNEPVLHPFQPYDRAATANQVEFFTRVFGLSGGPDSRDQIWPWKEALSLMAFVASLLTLVPLARVLLRLPYFSGLVHAEPAGQPAVAGRGRLVFWTLLVTGAGVACATYIPLSELSQRLFVAASNREATWFFPQRMNNAVMLWATLNGVVGFALFWAGPRLAGVKSDTLRPTWGTALSVGEAGRSLALAVLVFLGYYALLFGVYAVFHVDYRFLFMGVRLFQPEMLALLAMYGPCFFLFFLSNSLRVNGAMRFQGRTEWTNLLLAGLANAGGLLLIVLIQYVTFAATGTVYWTEGWLYVNLLFAVVPMMFVLPYFHRAFFRMTGRIYLGPMVTCLVFVMILLSNTVCYIPL